jgi:hypothetical protein
MSTLKFTSFLVALLLAPTVTAFSQSGRRQPKSTTNPTPPAVEIKTDTNTAQRPVHPQGSHRLTRKVELLIGRQFTSKHQTSEDTIYASLIQRLNEFANVSGTSIGDLKRQDAILRARKEKEALVIFLQFEVDNFQEGRLVLNSPDLEVKYFVFAANSGGLKTKGKVYYQAIGGAKARRSNWPTGPPIRITAEAAGIETAERVHDWLLVSVPK